MGQDIQMDPRIKKRLEVLRRSNKQAALAAMKAEKIISCLQSGDVVPDQAGTVTRHGEMRIKGVTKYDLGSGYRLVTIRHGEKLFLSYVGSHDECHRWIENNRDWTADQMEERCRQLPVYADQANSSASQDETRPTEEDFDPLAEVTQRDLRQIFCGLADGPN